MSGQTLFTQECPKCEGQLINLTGFSSTWTCDECGRDFSESYLNAKAELEREDWEDDRSSLTNNNQKEPIMSPELTRITGDASKDKGPLFPYSLDDLLYWVVKRKTGEIVKYTLVQDPTVQGKEKATTQLWQPSTQASYYGSLGEFCNHDLTPSPIFEVPGKRFFICDATGARKGKDAVDFVIDGGDVIPDLYAHPTQTILGGDTKLAAELSKFSTIKWSGSRVLKISWSDRKAPYLEPGFWPELAKKVKGDIMTCCQGGHGRSGTSLVCLMLALNEDYSARDAIVHLRAMHCPRAIEGADQHKYIDDVATYLDRPANSSEIYDIKSFKEAFLAMTHKSCKPYQDQLKAKQGK